DLSSEIFRPYYWGDYTLDPWWLGGIVEMLGVGPSRAMLEEARKIETHPNAQGYLTAFEAEIEFWDRDWKKAYEKSREAIDQLPNGEVLLKARLQAIVGEASRREGGSYEEEWSNALEKFPAVFRLLHLQIPIRVTDDGQSLSQSISKALLRSPRFREDS